MPPTDGEGSEGGTRPHRKKAQENPRTAVTDRAGSLVVGRADPGSWDGTGSTSGISRKDSRVAGASKKEGTDSVTAKAWTTVEGRRGRVGARKGTTSDHPPQKADARMKRGKPESAISSTGGRAGARGARGKNNLTGLS